MGNRIGNAVRRSVTAVLVATGLVCGMAKRFLSIFFAAALWSGSAVAGVIFDQPAGPTSIQRVSSTLDFFGGPSGFRSADNFMLATGGTIDKINWWGVSQVGGDDFTFTFYADSAGTPGAALLSTSGSLTKTPVFLGVNSGVFYQSDLVTDFVALAGTTYWLSVFNSAADASWSWYTVHNTGTGSLLQPNGASDWPVNQPDLSFQLEGTAAIPAPATIALLGLGLVGLGFSRRKKA